MSSRSVPSLRPPAQTADDALQLLDRIATHTRVTLSEAARASGMTVSKTHRLLTTLERAGYLSIDGRKAYALGPKLLYLGHRAARGSPLLRAAAPVLERLASDTGETSLLAIRFGVERLIVDSRDAAYGPQAAWPHDARLPLHSGALGICLLAHAPRSVLEDVVAGPRVAYAPGTVVDEGELLAALETVRRHGSYVARDSYVEGVVSIAAPVLGPTREAVASIAVVGSGARLDPQREARYRDAVRTGAAEVARYLT